MKDWDELAERTATQFAVRCPDKNVVFVDPGPVVTQFRVAYRRLLEAKLRQRNILVSEIPRPDLEPRSAVLTFEVQAFLYDHMGRQVPLVLLPVAMAFDDIASVYDTSRAEVMLTTSVEDGTFLRYRDPIEFYVRPSDLSLYMPVSESKGPSWSSHFVNDNPAAGVRFEWPDNGDVNLPALDALIQP